LCGERIQNGLGDKKPIESRPRGADKLQPPFANGSQKFSAQVATAGTPASVPPAMPPLHSALPLPPFSLTAKLSCSVSDDDFRFLEYCDRFPRRLSHCVDCADFDPAKGGATGINRRGLPKITAFIRDITAWIIPVSRAGDFPKGFFSRGQWRNLLPALCPL